jgi:hypothetical protein
VHSFGQFQIELLQFTPGQIGLICWIFNISIIGSCKVTSCHKKENENKNEDM